MQCKVAIWEVFHKQQHKGFQRDDRFGQEYIYGKRPVKSYLSANLGKVYCCRANDSATVRKTKVSPHCRERINET